MTDPTAEELRLRSARAVVEEICRVQGWAVRVLPAVQGYRPTVVLRVPPKTRAASGPSMNWTSSPKAAYIRKQAEDEDHAWLAMLDELKRTGVTS